MIAIMQLCNDEFHCTVIVHVQVTTKYFHMQQGSGYRSLWSHSELMKYVGNILEGMWMLCVQQEKQLYNMDKPSYGASHLTGYIINYIS